MHVALLTLGTRGDVQPFVALGRALQAAGHTVTVAAPLNSESLVISHQLAYAPLSADYQQMMESEFGRGALAGRPTALLAALREMKGLMRLLLEELWRAAAQAELIIYHPKALVGGDIAEKLGIPCFLAAPLPILSPTRAFPAPGVATRSLGGPLNRATYAAARSAALPFHGIINQWRRERLALPARSLLADPFQLGGRPLPVLYAFSRHIVPPPADWSERVHVTGGWFLETEEPWTAPEALRHFLEAGEPPVYVGFGSMAGRHPEKRSRLVLEALARSGRRGIVATGWGGLHPKSVPENVLVIEGAPHGWLFPRCAAVVHHGGAGTTAAGLRAGRPTVICPFFADQPFWGERIFRLGAGPRPIPQKRLTAERLAGAIEEATRDPGIRQRAAALGEAIEKEEGLRRAVEVIERLN